MPFCIGINAMVHSRRDHHAPQGDPAGASDRIPQHEIVAGVKKNGLIDPAGTNLSIVIVIVIVLELGTRALAIFYNANTPSAQAPAIRWCISSSVSVRFPDTIHHHKKIRCLDHAAGSRHKGNRPLTINPARAGRAA